MKENILLHHPNLLLVKKIMVLLQIREYGRDQNQVNTHKRSKVIACSDYISAISCRDSVSLVPRGLNQFVCCWINLASHMHDIWWTKQFTVEHTNTPINPSHVHLDNVMTVLNPDRYCYMFIRAIWIALKLELNCPAALSHIKASDLHLPAIFYYWHILDPLLEQEEDQTAA